MDSTQAAAAFIDVLDVRDRDKGNVPPNIARENAVEAAKKFIGTLEQYASQPPSAVGKALVDEVEAKNSAAPAAPARSAAAEATSKKAGRKARRGK